jgi:hypothetical protein
MFWKFSIISTILALVLSTQSASANHSRKIEFIAPGKPSKAVCEGDSIFTPKGSRFILDANQGVVFARREGSLLIMICRHENGGYQTAFVARGRNAMYQVSVRKFTNPKSFLEFVGPNFRTASAIERIAARSIGTVFTISSYGSGFRVGVDNGAVQVLSGGLSEVAIVGQGADLIPGQPPKLYQVDYLLGVKNLRVEQRLNENIVTGELVQGNVVDGATMLEPTKFILETDQPFITVRNVNGVGRVIWLPRSVRPFFGS